MKKRDISNSIPRDDAWEKISGQTKYLNDMEIEGCLWARTIRSTIARGTILKVKYPPVPEGYFIVDCDDVPGKNIVKVIEEDMPIFAQGSVNYIGEPIALVVGKDRKVIEEIYNKVEIEYEVKEGIYTIDAGTRFEDLGIEPIFKESNLFADYKMERDDPCEEIKKSKNKYAGTYSTGYQEHLYLEPQSVMGMYDGDEILVYGSMQCPYYVKGALVQALNMDEEKVNVIQTTTGGAFGGKEEYPSQLGAQVAVAALKCKAPVKLVFDRDEDVESSTKRHPSLVHIEGCVDENNKLLAVDIDIKLDSGAYAGLSKVILQRAMFAATAAYYVPKLRICGKSVATNTLVGGAYRGFGAPQTIFAFERFIEEFSEKLSMDSNEFRKINFLKQGDKSCTDGTFREFVPLDDLYNRINTLTSNRETDSDNSMRGIGYSFFYHGCGFTGSGEKDHIKAKVRLVKVEEEVQVLISNVEMGQGANTTLRKIVAHTLNIDINRVVFNNPDTRVVPDSGPTVASRTIMIVGKLLYDAAFDLRDKWDDAKRVEIEKDYIHPEGFFWNEETFKGDAYNSYSWGANAVEVEVDPVTMEVSIKNVWSIFDIGKAIDERIVLGQIDGGVAQGLGYAGMEVMRQKNGRILQRTSTDYIIPTSKDLPKMYRELYENPYELGPYGAKGLGEITFVGVPVAYANAVSAATGHKVSELPVTPEYLMRLEEKR